MTRPLPPRSDLPGHEVTNQPDPPGDIDLWQNDPAFREHAAKAGAQTAPLAAYGAEMGRLDMRIAGLDANRHPPQLRQFDQGGRRLDEVHFHPAYHRLLSTGIKAGYAAIAWEPGSKGGHATHAGLCYLTQQTEPGVCCPMTMTYAAVPALAANPALAADWLPGLTSHSYDPRIVPAGQKTGLTLGMAMTEKQGGSDVRSNATRAERHGGHYTLHGHKWFCSAPMSDGFLTLARAKGGLTCFLVPRWLKAERNAIFIMRLKDKLGNRANASSEIEYHGARAFRLGDEGRGIQTIVEMVHHTRLDTAIAPAGLMRAALVQVKWWVEHRRAFQKTLIDQPLMRTVLADLTLDWEATLALGLHMARAFDTATPEQKAFARIGVALAKYLGNKLAPNLIYEAMECLGGIGYTGDTVLPMLYREAPLNSIWEGSGNVICLDVLRTLAKVPEAGEALRAELAAATGALTAYDHALTGHFQRWPGLPPEAEARWYCENLATLLSASVLIRKAPSAVSDAYVQTRLAAGHGRTTGTITGINAHAIIARLGA